MSLTGSLFSNSLHFSQDEMQVTSMLNEDNNGLCMEEVMQERIWAMHEELCQKALRIARLYNQPMEYFHVSRADLRELGNDKQRLKLLDMKLKSVDAMLADGQGSSAEPSGPHETAARTTDPVQPVAPLLPCTSNPPRPSSDAEPTKRKRRVLDLDYYVQVYNRLLSERSSQQASCLAHLRAPAPSTEPFGPLDPATQPLLEIDPGVSAAIEEKRNIKSKLQKMEPGSQESPQYLWSWIVYFIRHIGRPALKDEVREAFHRAHPSLVRVGGRQIGLGEGQEWLSVPAAMAAAFPNGELSAFSEAQHHPKRRKRAADKCEPALSRTS